ncbi:MAG: methyltransferase domain-containing protein [Verrucomicrobiae bacterium]|nr:methyltransferase domain-containing protein [Verrucomicrobiae bacterium]
MNPPTHVGKVVAPQIEGYWEERYQKGEDAWDKGEPSPALVDFLATIPGDFSRGRVLVPGCGRGHDVRAWAAAGFETVGMDIAPTAIREARSLAEARAFPHAPHFVQESLFDLSAPWCGFFDVVFEHTLFCAIEPGRRGDYLRGLLGVLKPAGRFVAVFYNIQPEEGPPFGITREELVERFLPHFDLVAESVPRSWEQRQGKELFWHLTRKT